ncbi:hypothetical protein Mapa_002917 [Marchantia paleacea]|nr:hypothetical protein Mapa_002917 [Marchantia paleacea]
MSLDRSISVRKAQTFNDFHPRGALGLNNNYPIGQKKVCSTALIIYRTVYVLTTKFKVAMELQRWVLFTHLACTPKSTQDAQFAVQW